MFDDIKEILTKDRNKRSISNCLHTIALVRYTSIDQLKTLKKSWVTHVAQDQIFRVFLEKGYLEQKNLEFYNVTLKALKILEKRGFLVKQFMSNHHGKIQVRHRAIEVAEHQQALTSILLGIIHKPLFHTIIYPTFNKDGKKLLQPDAGVFYFDKNRTKLEFIEVERTEKDHEYLPKKKRKYEIIAKRKQTYDYLMGYFRSVGLPEPAIDQFCFSVVCYSVDKYDWEGWTWKSIKEI